MRRPKYSVIVPVCHGGIFLHRALESLGRLSSPPGGFEVIITAKPSEIIPLDGAPEEIHWQRVACDGNRSEMLNAACSKAQGEFWVFTDDDCRVPSDWLLNIERLLEGSPAVSVLGGSDILAPGGDDFDLALDAALNSWMGTGGIRAARVIKTGRYYPKLWNMVVSAEAAKGAAIDKGWIFDPSLSVHEDVDLVDRIRAQGGNVVHDPSVLVEHSRDTDFKSFFLRNMAMAGVCRKAGIHRAAHWGMALFFTILVLLVPASMFFPGISGVLPLFMGGVYGSAAMAVGIQGAWKKRKITLTIRIPLVIFSLHFSRTLGYLSPSRRTRY